MFWAYGTFGANYAPTLRREKHNLQTDQNRIPPNPRHLGVPLAVPKMISTAVVHSTQTVHLSCEINTISKWTETRFNLTNIT
jgi:hypothetical protein